MNEVAHFANLTHRGTLTLERARSRLEVGVGTVPAGALHLVCREVSSEIARSVHSLRVARYTTSRPWSVPMSRIELPCTLP
jgi:hypothetical protein